MTLQNIAIQHFVYTSSRSLMAGASICYAIENQRYLEVPLAFIFPSIYTGYHVYKNKDKIVNWLCDNI